MHSRCAGPPPYVKPGRGWPAELKGCIAALRLTHAPGHNQPLDRGNMGATDDKYQGTADIASRPREVPAALTPSADAVRLRITIHLDFGLILDFNLSLDLSL